MRTSPILQQLDSMDCGITCLRMVCKHHGKEYSFDTLSQICATARDGVSLLAISKAAERIGFRTLGGRFTFDKIAEKAPLPCIMHWDQNHFVVLYKVVKKRGGYQLFVADPAKGLLEYTQDTFISHWISTQTDGQEKGIGLLLEPTNVFHQQVADTPEKWGKGRVQFLFKYFAQHKKFFQQLILGLLMGSLLQLLFPFLTQAIVDVGIANQDIGFIWLVLLAQMMLLLGRTMIDFIRRRILLHISTRINVTLLSDFFIKLMKLPMGFFDTKLLGDLLQRIEDHSRVERFLTAQSLNVVFSLFTFIVFGGVLGVYNLQIFLVFLVGSLLYALWILLFVGRRRLLDYRYFEQQSINRSKVYQIINGMQEIKLQGCQQRKRWEWEDVQADLFEVNLENMSLQQTQEAGSICINELRNIIITILAATAVINGSLTLGMMLSVQYIIGQLNSPVEQLMGFIYQWQDVSISLERMSEIHGKENEESHQQTHVKQHVNQSIHINNLNFRYDGTHGKNTLEAINLCIPAGKVTAIVGASGSGKTTLIKLLLGYYPIKEGEILIGDSKLNQLHLSDWRKQCGAVMQDGFIFSESIARNIASSDEEIDLSRLQYAARLANIDEFISRLPLAYNTLIGQDGQGISQGQRQRILIARAIYRNPNFLFFDEATNALDANNEKVIVENMKQFYEGRTVIVVAHRLSTVKDADQIVVLHNGQIVEQGNHTALVAQNGTYFELVKNQLELGS